MSDTEKPKSWQERRQSIKHKWVVPFVYAEWLCERVSYLLERWAFLLIEAAAKMKIPSFPMWITPSQVRIVPVSEQFVETAVGVAERLRSRKVRAEVDDRNETVSNRVRLAEKDWIPYILVYGQKERETFTVFGRLL